MNRDKVLAAIIVPAIAFAFVVGVMGWHRWLGLARGVITVGLAASVVYSIALNTRFLNRLSSRVRGSIGLGISALLAVEVARVIHVMATDGFAIGDLLILVLDLLVFGLVFAWGLSLIGLTPGRALLRAAVRANKTDHTKALRLATTATRLYRRWDEAWLLKASIAAQDAGIEAQIRVLKDGLRVSPRSEEIRDRLITSLYANGNEEEGSAALQEFKDKFSYSGRPESMEALNAIGDEDWETAQAKLDESRKKAEKIRDVKGLIHIGAIAARHPDHFERAIAERFLESAIRIDPGDPSPLALLGILLERDQPTRSRDLFDQARQAFHNRRYQGTFDQLLDEERRFITPST